MLKQVIDRIRMVVFIKMRHDIVMDITRYETATSRRGCFTLYELPELILLVCSEECRPAWSWFFLKAF